MKSKDIGIAGLWMSCNYGAVLTSYALCRLLRQLGYTPHLIDHSGKPGVPLRFREKDTLFRVFFDEKGIATTGALGTQQEFAALNSQFNTFLVAADQVWRYDYNKKLGLYFFLDFVSPQHKKITYSSSFGTDICYAPDEFRQDASLYLGCFDGISTRERSGVSILKDQYGVDSTLVLDPVFMCDAAEFDACCKDSARVMPCKPYILSYVLNPNEEIRRIIQHVVQREDKALVNMVDAQFEFETKKVKLNLPNVIDNLSVNDWVFYMKHCDYLVTDSFHGVCFALIFRKPFVCIGNEGRGLTRFVSLFEMVGLMGRLVGYNSTPDELDQLPDIDWAAVHSILAKERAASLEWLINALNTDRSESKRMNNIIVHNLIRLRTEIADARNVTALHSSYNKLKSKYRYFWFMSKLSWGKKRKKYKAKRKQALSLIQTIKKREREWLKAYCPE